MKFLMPIIYGGGKMTVPVKQKTVWQSGRWWRNGIGSNREWKQIGHLTGDELANGRCWNADANRGDKTAGNNGAINRWRCGCDSKWRRMVVAAIHRGDKWSCLGPCGSNVDRRGGLAHIERQHSAWVSSLRSNDSHQRSAAKQLRKACSFVA